MAIQHLPLWLQKKIEMQKIRKMLRYKNLVIANKEFFQPKARWVRTKTLCEKLMISRQTLWSWVKFNEFPRFQVRLKNPQGKEYLRTTYDLNEVEKWLQKRTYGDAAGRHQPRRNDMVEALENLLNEDQNRVETE